MERKDFEVFVKVINPYTTNNTPPNTKKLGSSFILSRSLLVLKKATAMKKISANITPKSNIRALLNPLVALVSNSTKKTGPIVNAKMIPKGMADKMSSIIQFVFPTNLEKRIH
jgi:hypothetical protein